MNNRLALIFVDKEKMADFLIDRWKNISRDAIDRNGYFAVALSGGKTPLFFYRKLGKRKTFNWDKTHIFIVDERFMPFTHPDSNYRMIKNTLLRKAAIPKENVHPIPIDNAGPRVSAEKYEQELIKFFGLSQKEFPEFDLILLGMGEDGHTASLFPGSPASTDKEHLARPVFIDEKKHNRITITFPVINNAKNVFFLVTGKNKAKALRNAVEKRNDLLPASMVNPEKGTLLFLADVEAGRLLSKKTFRKF